MAGMKVLRWLRVILWVYIIGFLLRCGSPAFSPSPNRHPRRIRHWPAGEQSRAGRLRRICGAFAGSLSGCHGFCDLFWGGCPEQCAATLPPNCGRNGRSRRLSGPNARSMPSSESMPPFAMASRIRFTSRRGNILPRHIVPATRAVRTTRFAVSGHRAERGDDRLIVELQTSLQLRGAD